MIDSVRLIRKGVQKKESVDWPTSRYTYFNLFGEPLPEIAEIFLIELFFICLSPIDFEPLILIIFSTVSVNHAAFNDCQSTH